LARNIYSSVGDIGIQDAFNTGVNLLLVRESSLTTAYPFVTQFDIGTDPNQVPINGFLGTMAFQDSDGVNLGTASIGRITNASIDLGTAAAPTINFTGDTNTGFYSPGADQFAISTGGTGRMFVNASGSVGIATTPTERLDVAGDGASYLRWEHDGAGGAYSTSGGVLRIGPYFSATNRELAIYCDNGNTAWITTGTAETLVLGTNKTSRAYINAQGKFMIGTATANPGGAVLQTSDGLTFPATAVASADPNTLDDYEEGTWTPVVSFGGASVGITGTFSGTYTKVGNVVNAMFRITFTSKGSSTGTMVVSGMPFNAGTEIQVITGFGYIHRLATTLPAGQLILQTNGTEFYPKYAGYNSSNSVSLTNTDIGNDTDLRGGIVFRV
jgi:hypothetical protein